MGLASDSALTAAIIVMGCMLVWALYDNVRKQGYVLVGRSIVNIFLAALYISIRLNSGKTGNKMFLVTLLGITLACFGIAELIIHLNKK